MSAGDIAYLLQQIGFMGELNISSGLAPGINEPIVLGVLCLARSWIVSFRCVASTVRKTICTC